MNTTVNPSDLDSFSKNFKSLENDNINVNELLQLQRNLQTFVKERFENNIKAFEKHIPDIAKTFKSYKAKRPMEYFCTSNGIANMQYMDTKEIFYKVYDPLELCDRQIDELIKGQKFSRVEYPYEWDPFGQIHFRYTNTAKKIIDDSFTDGTYDKNVGQSVPMCIMLGAGLGYQIGSLYSKLEVQNLIIVEPSLDVFYASLHTFDWANLLTFLNENNYAIYIMLGQNEHELYEDLLEFYKKHGRFLSSFIWTFVHYINKDIIALSKILGKDYSRVYSAMGFFDDHLFGISHGIDHILKKKSFAREDQKLPSSFSKFPVFIIGNGPSLDNDIAFLRKYQDKALIIACGTAIDTLFNAGIKPDFYAALERTPQVREALDIIPDKEFFKDIILLTVDTCHPDTVDLFENTYILGKPDEPLFWLLLSFNPALSKKLKCANLVNPLVSNMGFSGAIVMGFKNLILFGVDNGTVIGEENFHSKYNSLYHKTSINDKDIKKYSIDQKDIVPGNFGHDCQSGYFYKMAKRHMEIMIENYEGINCINCSNGAYIDHTTPIHSCDMQDKFDSLENLDKKAIKAFIMDKLTFKIDLDRNKAKQMCMYDQFKEIVNSIIKELDNKAQGTLQVVFKMEKISEYIYALSYGPTRYFSLLLEGSIQNIFIQAMAALYRSKDADKNVAVANQILDLLKYMLEDSIKLYDHMPDYILGKHHQYLNGKVGFDHPGYEANDTREIYHLYTKDVLEKIEQKSFEKRYK